MNIENVERLLINSKESFVPDIFERIKDVRVEPQKKKVKIFNKEKSILSRWSFRLASAAMSLILVFALFYNYSINAEYERVYIDLNPSVEFVVNKYDRVIDYNYLNEDAENLYKGVNIKNKKIEDLIDIFVEKAKEKGYFSSEENEINISVYSEKKDAQNRLEKLLEKLDSSIQKRNIICNIVSKKITKEEREKALSLNISPVKYALINKIIAVSDYSFEQLKDMSIKQLKTLYNSLDKNVNDNDNSNGNGNSDNNGKDDSDNENNEGNGNGNSDNNGKDDSDNENKNNGNGKGFITL